MDHLTRLENESIYIIRETYAQYRDSALLWSTGKDSTIMLWIARKAFFGEVPFPVIHIDTGCLFSEIYEYREKYSKAWDLRLSIAHNKTAREKGIKPDITGKKECCEMLKSTVLKDFIKTQGLKAMFFGIRGDEQGFKGSEGATLLESLELMRDYPHEHASYWDIAASKIYMEDHVRIHPLLHWTEADMWQYVKHEKIPVLNLYFAAHGKRYTSIGCVPCCYPVDSHARSIDQILKELSTSPPGTVGSEPTEDTYTIQKLKSLGYM